MRVDKHILVARLALTLTGFVVYGSSAAVLFAQESQPSHVHAIPEELRAEATRYMGYHSSLKLTPAQLVIKQKALESIPAPCCSKFSMATCCCECNLARSAWGLSNHLITERGYGPEEVKAQVEDWIKKINPEGFSGDACFSGGCNRSFDKNGCGGMNERELR